MSRPARIEVAEATSSSMQGSSGHETNTLRVHALKEIYLPPLVVFLASRVLLAILAFLAPHVLGTLHKNRPVLPHSDPLATFWNWTSPWFRFDAGWYVGIAQHGYHWGKLGTASTNFFPLYPLLIRILAPFTLGSFWISALFISNVAFLFALIFLWQWTLMHWESETALRVLLLTAVFPFGFFFAAPYAESLFLLFAIATFALVEKEQWVAAAVCAGLCTATRPVGIAVALALIVLAVRHRDRSHLLYALSSLLPLVAFIVYLTVAFGQPLAFLTYHSAGWVAPHGGLLQTLGSQFHSQLSPLDRIDAAVALLFLVSGVLAWYQLGPEYAVYLLVGVLLPLVHGLVSMERYVIVLFPAFAVWATWKSKWGQLAIFSLSLLLLVMATMMFAVGFSIF